MKMVDGGSKNLLPHDLIIDILSRIPCKSLIRFRCVSKPWCSLICDPYFIRAHYDRAKKGPPTPIFGIEQDDESRDLSISVVNERKKIVMKNAPRIRRLDTCIPLSCNGLICLYSHLDNHVLYVFNPATRQSLTLPNDISLRGRVPFAFCFFGFHPRTKEYKVVRLFYRKQEYEAGIYNIGCEVFTLGSKSWRPVEDLKDPLVNPNHSVSVNGSIYGLLDYKINKNNDLISSFDLEHEKFSVIPFPQGMENIEDSILLELEGTLWLSNGLLPPRVDLWCLRDHTNYPSRFMVFKGPHKLCVGQTTRHNL